MTDIEQKALALVNEVAGIGCYALCDAHPINLIEALCRAIEQHEAFRQEVSKVMTYIKALYPTLPTDYDRFIIPAPKPDLLVRIINEVIYAQPHGDINEVRMADDLRAALEARGLEIREKGQ
jgi:hypothetical protein